MKGVNPMKRRICRLSDSRFRNIDLRRFEKEIIDTINETVPGKNPKVTEKNFSTDELTQSEAIKLGRALAKLEDLVCYGKQITIFQLFEGHLQDVQETANSTNSEAENEVKEPQNNKVKGGHMA